MAKNGVLSRLKRWEENEGVKDLSPCIDSHEVHVLAVDDSLVDRKVIEGLLKITSCKVTAVDSGRRALQVLGLDEQESSVGFDDIKVDLIITDYCMPGMTGYELLKRIKGSSTFKETPVVIMSSENILSRIDRCLKEGAEDFIVKPVKLSDVRRLKSYMFGESRIQGQDREFIKGDVQETCDVSPSSSTDEGLSSPPTDASRSFPPSPSRQSLPPSPSSLGSPTGRLETSIDPDK